MTRFDLITTEKWIWLVDNSSLLLPETMCRCHFPGIKKPSLKWFVNFWHRTIFVEEISVPPQTQSGSYLWTISICHGNWPGNDGLPPTTLRWVYRLIKRLFGNCFHRVASKPFWVYRPNIVYILCNPISSFLVRREQKVFAEKPMTKHRKKSDFLTLKTLQTVYICHDLDIWNKIFSSVAFNWLCLSFGQLDSWTVQTPD